MAKHPDQLNQKQVDVLQWIGGGCPEGVYEGGYEHRIVARALERRGLIAIAGRGSTWEATITDAGRARLANPSAPTLPESSDADRLVAAVLEADGQRLLPDDPEVERENKRLVRLSLQSPLRPKGKRLVMVPTGRWGRGPKAITLAEYFDDFVEARPVPVPDHVGRYHPAVKAFLADKDWQYVSREHLSRAARILQAIATEARKRGIEVLTAQEAVRKLDQYEARHVRRAHLALRTSLGVYGLQIREISVPGGPTVEPRPWGSRWTGPAWLEGRRKEFISTGKLELIVNGPGTSDGGEHHRDAKSRTVEDKLPEVFRSFEIHRHEAEWREQERQREAAERQRRWEAAMASAKDQYAANARWEQFAERSREWQAIQQHRAFLAVAKTAAEAYLGDNKEELLARLDDAAARLDELDPILQLPRLIVEVPEPGPNDLKPFLGGWSPYGP